MVPYLVLFLVQYCIVFNCLLLIYSIVLRRFFYIFVLHSFSASTCVL